MSISATQVKELRERTGLGMMECKAALTETAGDMDAAVELLRKKAGSKVEKKAGRTAADGAIGMYIGADRKSAAIVEVNSETDFVAKGDDFVAFAEAVAEVVATSNPSDVDALYALPIKKGGQTIAQVREGLVMKLGENIGVRRFARYQSNGGHVGGYLHGRKIAVIVDFEGGNEILGKDLAMHVAASKPEFISKEQVSASAIASEKAIFTEQAQSSGKPANIIEKMVEGRIAKYINEITLLGQPFVKDPEISVEKLLKNNGSAKVLRFERFEVGEGIEKKTADFAAEVMATVKGS
jgi:elongation factor Ts